MPSAQFFLVAIRQQIPIYSPSLLHSSSMKFCCSCAAGLETILKKEIQLAGYTLEDHKPTLVRFQGDLSAIAKINLWSRVGNKVFMELACNKVFDFDELFALMQSIDWKKYIQ